MPDLLTQIYLAQQSSWAKQYCWRVVTLAEAEEITGVTRTPLLLALQKGKITGRKSLTGGEWLIDLHSLLTKYPAREPREKD